MELVLSIEELSTNLRSMWEEQDANAAVALVLRLEDGRPWILFVKRIQNSSDPWSGQIALPGGKRQPEDEDLKETVIRETLEETKINLLDNCRFLGTLSTFQSKPRPEVKVLPFVILFRSAPSIRLNERELEEYFWIPLDELVKNRTMAKSSFGKVAAYTAGNRIIWGLTYRIVENLIHCIQKGRQLGNSNDLEHKT